jgi:hypothetical protein
VGALVTLDFKTTDRFYYIVNTRDLDSRQEVSDEPSFSCYLSVLHRPLLLLYAGAPAGTGNSGGSPEQLPSSLGSESSLSGAGGSANSETSSSRGNAHKVMTAGVRKRDSDQCVVTGEQIAPNAGNVQNAHIFPVNEKWSTPEAKDEAGVFSAYDVTNGILLSSAWHSHFDGGGWCMDADLTIHLGAELKENETFAPFDGKKIRAPADPGALTAFPSRLLLATRFRLWKAGLVTRR